MKNVILIAPELTVWSNFKKMCLTKGLPYHSLKVKKFPIEYKGITIYKKQVK
jgi:hypothetical protein